DAAQLSRQTRHAATGVAKHARRAALRIVKDRDIPAPVPLDEPSRVRLQNSSAFVVGKLERRASGCAITLGGDEELAEHDARAAIEVVRLARPGPDIRAAHVYTGPLEHGLPGARTGPELLAQHAGRVACGAVRIVPHERNVSEHV